MSWYLWIIIFIFLFVLKQWLRGRKNIYHNDITKQLVIITGSSSGLGKATAKSLLANGVKVVYACRNEKKALKEIDELPKEYRQNASFLPLDLCSFKSIQQFADSVKTNYPPIDILINNAGAAPDEYKLTEDNLESYIQGNHLGPMLLTLLLLDHFNPQSKIINVSSRSHKKGNLTTDSIKTLSDNELIKEYYYQSFTKTLELYGATKLMNIYFTQYLAEMLPKKYNHIKAASLHPGFVNTPMTRQTKRNILRNIIFALLYPLFLFISKNEEEGIQTHLHLCYMPFQDMTSGAYYVDCALAPISNTAKDIHIRDAIIQWSINTLKNKVGNINIP